ncbi:MAG TPA: ABC transporter permease [Chloroflexota bacterium]|nr:ABC transporter permease [Chloroflexota bacterium]
MTKVVYDTDTLRVTPSRLLAAVWARRELIGTLALRDVRARYQQSILGVYWTVLNPLATAAVFTVVFSLIAQVPVGATPYAVFVLCGLVPWNFFANAMNNATGSLVGMAGLLTKVAFPREILPLAAIVARLVDLLVSFVVLLVIMLWYRVPFHWTILLLPIPIAIELTFLIGLGLLLSAANLFYRDVSQLLGVILSLWIFLTPVVYPIDRVPPRLQALIELNPLTPVVSGFRTLALDGQLPATGPLIVATLVSLITLGLGYAIFKWLEPVFAETV